MDLRKLEIERKLYGSDKGKHIGAISFDSEIGEVTLKLTPDMIEQIFAVCADGLILVAKEAANNMTCAIIEHQKSIENDYPLILPLLLILAGCGGPDRVGPGGDAVRYGPDNNWREEYDQM